MKVPRGLPGRGVGLAQPDSNSTGKLASSTTSSTPCTALQMVMVMVLQQAACMRLRSELSNQQQSELEQKVTMNGAMSELWSRKHQQIIRLRTDLGAAKAAFRALKAAAQDAGRAPARRRRMAQAIPSPDVIAQLKAAAESNCNHLRKADAVIPAAAVTAANEQHEPSSVATTQHIDEPMEDQKACTTTKPGYSKCRLSFALQMRSSDSSRSSWQMRLHAATVQRYRDREPSLSLRSLMQDRLGPGSVTSCAASEISTSRQCQSLLLPAQLLHRDMMPSSAGTSLCHLYPRTIELACMASHVS